MAATFSFMDLPEVHSLQHCIHCSIAFIAALHSLWSLRQCIHCSSAFISAVHSLQQCSFVRLSSLFDVKYLEFFSEGCHEAAAVIQTSWTISTESVATKAFVVNSGGWPGWLQQVEERLPVRVQDLQLFHQGLLQLQLPYQGQARTSSPGEFNYNSPELVQAHSRACSGEVSVQCIEKCCLSGSGRLGRFKNKLPAQNL